MIYNIYILIRTLILKCFILVHTMTMQTLNIPRGNIKIQLGEGSEQLSMLCGLSNLMDPFADVGVLLVLWEHDAQYRLTVEIIPQGDYNHHALRHYTMGDTLLPNWWTKYRKSGGMSTYLMGGSLAFVKVDDLSDWLMAFNLKLKRDILRNPIFVLHKNGDRYQRVLVNITH